MRWCGLLVWFESDHGGGEDIQFSVHASRQSDERGSLTAYIRKEG